MSRKLWWGALAALLLVGTVAASDGQPPDVAAVARQLSIAQARWRHETGTFAQVWPLAAPTATPVPRLERARVAQLARAEARFAVAASTSPLPTPTALPQLALVSPLPLPGTLALPAGVTVTVNIYTAPAGDGWEAVYEYSDAGATWRMVENHGPEAWRAQDWHLLSPLATPEAR